MKDVKRTMILNVLRGYINSFMSEEWMKVHYLMGFVTDGPIFTFRCSHGRRDRYCWDIEPSGKLTEWVLPSESSTWIETGNTKETELPNHVLEAMLDFSPHAREKFYMHKKVA